MSRTDLSHSKEYRAWDGMFDRCYNKAAANYSAYGGRGITVDPRWSTFASFFADMGPAPTGTTLDRIDNDKGYGPGNCRWVSHQVNCNNRRTTRKLTHQGKTQSVKDWARELGVPYKTFLARVNRRGAEHAFKVSTHASH